MNNSSCLLKETDSQSQVISWYRTPLDPKFMKAIHQRSDWRGAFQAFSYLGLLISTGSLTFYASGHWPLGVTLLLLFLHGTVCAFRGNAVHELEHGTVFKTKFLNAFFTRLFAFFGWHNVDGFNSMSHTRHHRYTLHPPDDLEVVLPSKFALSHLLRAGILFPRGFYEPIKAAISYACDRFESKWETFLYPEGSEQRKSRVKWARTMLAGHALIIGLSIYFHLWIVPLLTTFTHAYGGWLSKLCNNTQHIGLQDNVPDFRFCCRTFTVNPVVQFLYWHMNFHTEHHMYAAVPCYNLGRLHAAIRHDLPPCPHGLVATWKEIFSILKIQEANPEYQHIARLPETVNVSLVSGINPAPEPS